jgi:hypothetical protein
MKRSFSWALVLMVVSSLVLAPGLFSQIKQDPQTKLDRIEGTVLSIDKAKMTLVIRETGTANLDYTIIYTDKTIYTYRNGPAKAEDVKDGVRIVALGKAEGATKLNAARIDIRAK